MFLIILLNLENFVLRTLREIGVDFDKSWIVACHRLGKTDRTIVKFLKRKDAENVFSNKKKLKEVDISCLLSDGLQDKNNMTIGGHNDWRNGGLYRKRETFVSQNLFPCYRYLYGLVKEKKADDLIFDFWVFNGTNHMRKLQDSRIINITHESDISYFLILFLDKPSLLGWKKESCFYHSVMIFHFYELLHAIFSQTTSVLFYVAQQ